MFCVICNFQNFLILFDNNDLLLQKGPNYEEYGSMVVEEEKKSFFCFFQINHGTLKYLGSGPERDQTPCSQIILTTRLKLVMPCYLQQAGCFSTCSTNGYTFQIEMILFLTIRQMLLTTNVVIRNPQVCQSYMSEVEHWKKTEVSFIYILHTVHAPL